MHLSTPLLSILLLLLPLITASSTPLNGALSTTPKTNLLPGVHSSALLALSSSRDDKPSTPCNSTQQPCDGKCIPSTGTCCATGTGGFCTSGMRCVPGGCCPTGATCSGPPAGGCPPEKTSCHGFCIPKGSVCCPDGAYCDKGDTCTPSGFCEKPPSKETICDEGRARCGVGCMPQGQVCCATFYCSTGETCASEGKCSTGRKGSGGDMCAAGEDRCGEGCMPGGQVCCETYYCYEGQSCAGSKRCRRPGFGGSSGVRGPGTSGVSSAVPEPSTVRDDDDDGSGGGNGSGNGDDDLPTSSVSRTAMPGTATAVRTTSVTVGAAPSVTSPGVANGRYVEGAVLIAGLLAAAPLVI
ncbi:hypothetical protein CPLU01_08584 [Colletotrichum plurivorum]|uniref:GPI anchored protein n=1 Tax=Colletotrichum plurivorum TaxID=2175906 RepID=A0A8H6KB23_9PEZI|nr:hypothetical protein CPLU01_08584 [Colletotrichum plurivorum]